MIKAQSRSKNPVVRTLVILVVTWLITLAAILVATWLRDLQGATT
jgi:hypothetical protein